VIRRLALKPHGAAIALLLGAAPGFTQSRDPETQHDALVEAIARGDAPEALRLAGERAAVAERDKAEAPLTLASALEALAVQMAELPAAEASSFAEIQLRRSLELQETAGRALVELLPTLGKLSELHFVAGRWKRSEEFDRRCVEIALDAFGADDPRVTEARRNLSLSVFNQGRFRDAEALQLEVVSALEHARPAQSLDLAKALGDLAENLRAQDRHREATPLFERSVRLAEEAVGRSDPELVTLLINLGGLYRDTNRYAESQWRLGQARQILEASEHPDPVEMVSLLNNLAEVQRFQGDYPGAEGLYSKAIEIARRQLGDEHPRLATYLNQLGELYAEERREADAERLYGEALAMRERLLGPDHLDVAYTEKCRGLLFTRAGRLPEAEQALRRALAIQESRLGPRHPEVAVTLRVLAEAVVPKNEARALLERAIAILDDTQAAPLALAEAYAYRAGRDWREGRRTRARGDMARALGIIETLRPEAGGGEHTRARYFSRFVRDFQRMVSWELQAGRIDRAFEYAERARGRALLDQLAAGGVDLRSGIEPVERSRLEKREADLQSQLAERGRALKELYEQPGPAEPGRVRAIEELLDELKTASVEFQHVYEEIKNASRFWRAPAAAGEATVTLERAQRLLAADELMLFYVIGDEESVVLTIPPRGQAASAHRLVVTQAQAAALGVAAGALTSARLRQALAPNDPNAPEGLLARLSSPPPPLGGRPALEKPLHALWEVLAPSGVRQALRHRSGVVLVPDDLLHQLPFEALVVAPGSQETPVRYWLDEGLAIRYAASASALARLADRAPAPTPAGARVLTVSDPIFDPVERGASSLDPQPSRSPGGRALSRLPGTARESEAIRAAFAAAGSMSVAVLQQLDARESALRAALPGARYIHLATHGLVDESHGDLLASLALTPPPVVTESTDDGQLQLYEIYGLDTRSELTVLSSCESRVGRLEAGEGVFALSRAFLASGARRVVASLWPAEDDATAEIMGRLFQAIAKGDQRGVARDYSAALTRAKRAVRARPAWADPFFWAPFVLEGVR